MRPRWANTPARRAALTAGLLLGLALAAAVFAVLGRGVPCVFHLITGLDCPGCGGTRMLLALLRGDLAAAWRYNPCLLTLLPVLIWLLLSMALRYIPTGSMAGGRGQTVAAVGMAVCLLAFGVARNLPGYPY